MIRPKNVVIIHHKKIKRIHNMNNRYALTACLIFFCLIFFSLTKSVQSNDSLNNEFMKAVHEKDYLLMEKLLNNGADINTSDKENSICPLAIAASDGDVKLVNFLLKKSADPHGNQAIPNLPIYLAISNNHLTIVNTFINLAISPNYAWPNRNGGTLLIAAIQFGHLKMVELLVKLGADVNFCGNSGNSPLYRSIIYEHFEMFQFLLRKGAFLNKYDLSALTDLEWWKHHENTKYIELLKKDYDSERGTSEK